MTDKEVKDEYIDVEVGRGHTRIHLSTRKMLMNNLLGGIAWGFGTVLGATLIVAIVLFILSKLNTVPFIGDFISRILEEIQTRNSF
ncbi:MAG: hypothetical protein A2864_01495 [Candidatus Woykebacteria bacterium RIFCSPHIGHO2_01_FULL_39_12]|uniref:Uncharacterized protein n=1 Tax=Candidatus Woykebacteria bacterium RIFCSPHIGHO2_01_FULL_39_12 TaxID=1802599 RepID=A0A1G1WHR3_9BACT|nr:MAG: hypothetical protein A2864_01495 [Candidatus Woykebacteria bacterium RIFCSPHIGHO2_01_FULL_39_12]